MPSRVQSYVIAGQIAQAVPIVGPPGQIIRLHIWLNNVAVGPIYSLHTDKTRWYCEQCGYVVRTKLQMLTHLHAVHYRRMLH